MSLYRAREYPTQQPMESTEKYIKRLRDAMQEETTDRLKDFDILQLANVPWVDVRTYGAKGDDSTDDSVAIQAAIDSLDGVGGVVFFPSATYKIGTALDIPNDDYQYQLIGTGTQSSILHYTGSDKAVDASGTVDNRCFFRMRDMQVLGEDDAGNAADDEAVTGHRRTHAVIP